MENPSRGSLGVDKQEGEGGVQGRLRGWRMWGGELLVWMPHRPVGRDAQHAPATKEFWACGQRRSARLFLSS